MTEEAKTNLRRAVSLEKIVDDDPEVVALHGVASDVYDLLEDMLEQVVGIEIPVAERERESVRRWTLYLGTMANEMLLASSHLAIADNPRAQIVLNRTLFEYFIRNQWMLRHPAEATRLLDSLEAFVARELKTARGLFDAARRQVMQANYDKWAATNPGLNKQAADEETFAAMCRDVLDSRFDPEFFWSYGFPSIIAHGKPHGIQDVFDTLQVGKIIRSVQSLWLDRRVQLGDAAGYGLQYVSFVGINFGLDLAKFREITERFGEILKQFGITPEVISIKRTT